MITAPLPLPRPRIYALLSPLSSRARAIAWVCGSLRVPITSAVKTPAMLPDLGAVFVYHLDVSALTPRRRRRLVAYLSRRCRLAPENIAAGLEIDGFPIYEEGVVGLMVK